MIKALRFLLYPFVFVLVYGNSLYSESSHDRSFHSSADRIERNYAVFISHVDFLDFIEQAFPFLLEENSSENQDDDGQNNRVPDQGNGLQHHWVLSFAGLIRTPAVFFPSYSPAGQRTLLYLLHQVFRI